MFIRKSLFWVYIVLAFFLGTLTHCSLTLDKDNVPRIKEKVVLVVPPEKAKEASELYAKVYAAASDSHRGAWAEEDANKAVMSVYGQAAPKF